MCLYVKKRDKIYSEEELKALIETVKKKKTVYKAFRIEKTGDKIRLFSPYRDIQYYLGQEYTSEIDIKNDYSWNGLTITVEKGLHAFRQHKGSMRGLNNNSSFVIIPCIIPVGAQYVIGREDEIVSNKLILPDSFIYQGEEYNINY